jgi:ferredoxin
MRVTVDPRQCGCTGYCARLAPSVFTQAPGEAARTIPGAVPTDMVEPVREAAAVCPTNAIVIQD